MASCKSVSKTRGDNNIQKFLLFVLLVVICASKGFSIASAAVTPEVVLQELTNEKMRYFNLQEVTAGNDNNQQQQQQKQRQQLQVIANDLQEQSEATNNAAELQRNKQQQQQQKQQQYSSSGDQAQTSSNGKFVSQGNVINGNQATYVEPPADFKPIIYDYDKQQQQQQQSQSRQPNESLESSFNQMMPVFANRLSPIQQHQQAVAITSDSTTTPDNPSNGDKSSSPALKPSIGRWSDWHDMSIEPDLASSDSAAQATFYSIPHYAPFALPPPAFITPYRTRYQARPENALKGTKTRLETMPKQVQQVAELAGQLNPEQEFQQELEQQEIGQGATKIGQNVGQSSISGNQGGSVVKRTPPQLQIKGGQLANLPNSASGSIKISTLTEIPENMSTKLTLNQHPISQNSANSDNVKMQQSHELNQQQASTLQASGFKQQQEQSTSGGSGVKSGLLQQQQKVKQAARQSKNQRRIKRRRKSKTNAEVRIQQLVAASQKQQELLANGNKQVNGLVASPASTKLVNQKQFQQHQSTLMEHSTGQDLVNQQTPVVHQLPAQQQLHNLLVNSKTISQQQVGGKGLERVFNTRQPIKSLNYQTLGNIQLQNRPAIIVKRFGNFPIAHESQALNASAPIKAAPHHQRKRKIKTQLPVGLSSWFLGGIRDLDGRHWNLPAEVISRLAVNDVDFVGSDKTPKVGIPIAGSVILVPAQNIDQTATFVPPPSSSSPNSNLPAVNRVPINQLVPR